MTVTDQRVPGPASEPSSAELLIAEAIAEYRARGR